MERPWVPSWAGGLHVLLVCLQYKSGDFDVCFSWLPRSLDDDSRRIYNDEAVFQAFIICLR